MTDSNVILPIAIESVQTDGGAFNVREGNNSVNTSIVLGNGVISGPRDLAGRMLMQSHRIKVELRIPETQRYTI